MTAPTDEKLKKAIDEALTPLYTDHARYLANAEAEGLPVSRADLHYVFDQYGTLLLDFGAVMAPIGHRHGLVHEAVKEHMDYYIRTAPTGEHIQRWTVEYAAHLAASFVDEDAEPKHQVLFTEGEREAVRVAVDIAVNNSDSRTVAVVGSFHDWYTPRPGVTTDYIPVEHFFLDQYPWTNYAAVLISLVTDDGAVLDPKWVQEVANRAKNVQTTVIIDESRTGFGRFGTMWGQTHHQIDADITVLGGPVGGGMALGAVVATPAWFRRYYGSVSPQAGSPVACCAGAQTLKGVNVGVLEHVKEAGPVMAEALTTLTTQFPEYLTATHGTGLWQALDFKSPGHADQFFQNSRDHGLLVARPVGSTVVLTPPLIASEVEIKRGVDLIAAVLLSWQEAEA